MRALLSSIFPACLLSIACIALSSFSAPPQATPRPVVEPLMFDCNDNGIEDSVDIALGASTDQNQNGVPDECEAADGEALDAGSAK